MKVSGIYGIRSTKEIKAHMLNQRRHTPRSNHTRDIMKMQNLHARNIVAHVDTFLRRCM